MLLEHGRRGDPSHTSPQLWGGFVNNNATRCRSPFEGDRHTSGGGFRETPDGLATPFTKPFCRVVTGQRLLFVRNVGRTIDAVEDRAFREELALGFVPVRHQVGDRE